MTNKHEHLDGAIEAAEKATEASVRPNTWMHEDNRSHDFARALVAELLRGMDGSDFRYISPAMVYGFNAALAEIKHRAGLEVEG